MADILFVTWDGGGNVPPALGIARELAARGHTIRFLGHQAQRDELATAGFETVPPRHARPFDCSTDFSPWAMMATFGDRGLGRDLLAAVASRPADLVVIDALLFGAMRTAADAGLPYVALEHMYDAAFSRLTLGGPMGLNLRARRLRPRQTLDTAEVRILCTAPSLDPVRTPQANLRQVGPVVDVAARRPTEKPTVLVSLSTFGFPKMQSTMQSVLDAAATLDTQVVVTTGPMIDPADLDLPPGAEVHRYLPHVEVLPRVDAVVGHGGHGTTMQALAHDLPVLVIPMSRLSDQPLVGRSLVEAGAGFVAERGAAADVLAPLLATLLADGPHRAAAARLGAEIRNLPGATLGADAVEETLVRTSTMRRSR